MRSQNQHDIGGRIAVVTGGGAGIGLGIVRVLAERGARVVMAERNASGEGVAETLRADRLDVRFVPCDVSDVQSIEKLFAYVEQQYGAIDGLVNNAGITIHEDFLEVPLEHWQRQIDTNLRSTFLCSQHAARMMRPVQRGSIINISSNHAGASMEGFECYAATKGGITSMTRAMAWSLGRYNIRVNSISPGLTSTDHIRQLIRENAELGRLYHSLHATHRINASEDIGELVAFLMSDASIAMTGADLLADNGLSAHLFNRHGN
ncbi:SDR family oxidoreductase [Burkholderia sp. Nafp2/4-1b]|uniref:SDR family NAD(P)-dependent oxidoreductase n=1 Tax=Burkholderia sp. Nafp2/4-1b TaxID=2116686 RepID=UPI000EF893BA|nr:SDR family oxidoreductase [Burkholderia sp. Nafp2/4-1b]